MSHESVGKSDEYYTPEYVFDALCCVFDLDVAAPKDLAHVKVPSWRFISDSSLEKQWDGFIWMNPQYGNQSVKRQWLTKFFEHGNGIALMPDRTSAPWWQEAAKQSDAILFVSGKIKFIRPDGSTGDQPSNGTTLLGIGHKAVTALREAQKNNLGTLFGGVK